MGAKTTHQGNVEAFTVTPIAGETYDKVPAVVLVDSTGAEVTSLGGGGDATAANQVTGNASLASINSKVPALGQALAAASVPVVLTAAQLTTLTPAAKPTTGTQSSVANAASNVTLLASNASRKGATIFNDDTASTGATLKIKLGATASASSFTYAIPPQGYYEVPFGYTGIIDGIASAATGNARITELT